MNSLDAPTDCSKPADPPLAQQRLTYLAPRLEAHHWVAVTGLSGVDLPIGTLSALDEELGL